MSLLFRRVTLTFALLALGIAPVAAQQTPAPIVVRFGLNESAGQGEVIAAIRKYDLARKYGFDVQDVDMTAPGQQYLMFRADTIDTAPGAFIDLIRQRKAGVELVAFHGFQGYSNFIVVPPSSPIHSFADLKGKRMGEFGTTFLDWLILRAAGKKAFGFDIEQSATLVKGSPPLLNQLMAKGDVDAMLQYSTSCLEPIRQGQQRFLTDVPGLMKRAGFVPTAFFSNWNINEHWVTAHPGAVKRLSAMLDEAYKDLRTDDSLWPGIAQALGITDPDTIAAYRDEARRIDNPPYNRALLVPTQQLLDAVNAIAGEDATGITTVDPAAFLFPNEQR